MWIRRDGSVQGPLWPREIREIVTAKFMKVHISYWYAHLCWHVIFRPRIWNVYILTHPQELTETSTTGAAVDGSIRPLTALSAATPVVDHREKWMINTILWSPAMFSCSLWSFVVVYAYDNHFSAMYNYVYHLCICWFCALVISSWVKVIVTGVRYSYVAKWNLKSYPCFVILLLSSHMISIQAALIPLVIVLETVLSTKVKDYTPLVGGCASLCIGIISLHLDTLLLHCV